MTHTLLKTAIIVVAIAVGYLIVPSAIANTWGAAIIFGLGILVGEFIRGL